MQHTRQTRITANLVGMMLFVQVILGGSATLLGLNVIYHLVWGTLTFIVAHSHDRAGAQRFRCHSTLFKVTLASIVDFVIQGILGLFSVESGIAVVVHLTNAFLLAVIVTYLISFADSADNASATIALQTKTAPSGHMPS